MHSPGMLTIYTNRQTRRGGRMVPYNSLWACSLGQGGKRKESLQLCLCNLNICIKKVDAKCWLVEMTVTTSLPFACVFQCLFTFALISALPWVGGNLTAQLTGSHRAIGAEIQIPEMCLQALLPFPALESLLTGYPYKRETDWEEHKHCIPPPTHICWSFPNGMLWSTWFSNWNAWLCHVNGKYPWQLETLVTTIGFGP